MQATDKTTFIPESSTAKGGNVIQMGAHKGKKGYVVQFSPFLFPRIGRRGGEGSKKYQYFS